MPCVDDVERELLAHPIFGRGKEICKSLDDQLSPMDWNAASGMPTAVHLSTGRDGDEWAVSELTDAVCIQFGNYSCVLLDQESSYSYSGFAEAFDEFVRADFPTVPLRLVTAESAEVERLSSGAALLCSLFPRLGTDTLRYVGAIALFESDGALLSTTLADLSGVVFLDRRGLSDSALTTELLFHEGLHAKLDALDRSIPLLRPDSRDNHAALVTVVWHRAADGTNQWPVLRAVAAFHVYAHLVFLADALVETEAHRRHGERLRPRALFRAHYLGRELLRSAGGTLTEAGSGLVDWLMALLPPPEGFNPAERYLIEVGVHRLAETRRVSSRGSSAAG